MTYGTDAPNGLVPITTLSAASTNFALPFATIQIASGYGTSLFVGDPIAPNTDGTAIIATAGNVSMGVFNGCVYTGPNGVINLGAGPSGQAYWQAGTVLATGTVAQANIIGLDPNTLYSIQTNSSNGVPITSNFSNANFVAGTGNTSTGISAYALDQSSIATTATLNLRIWGVDPNSQWSDGSGSAGFNNVIVSINNHFARAGTTGV